MLEVEPSDLDSIDRDFIEILRGEFAFAGDGDSEASLMISVADKGGRASVWDFDAIAQDTAKWKSQFLLAATALGVDPTPISKYRFLVIPDYSFGASSRQYKDRAYVLLYSGCMNFASYVIELNIICCELLLKAPDDQLTQTILEWVVSPARGLAQKYLSVPFGLPLLRAYMTEQMSLQEFFDVSSAELFIVFHEIAHIELGHLGAGFGELGALNAMPTPAEEYEADQFAINCLKRGRDGALFGALTFLSLLAEFDSDEEPSRNGPVTFNQRFLAIREKLDDEHRKTVHYACFIDTFSSSVDSDSRILTRQLLWACEQLARELNIPVQPDATPSRSSRRRPIRSPSRSTISRGMSRTGSS